MPHPENTPVYRIKVAINRFESVPGQYTLLVANWSIRSSKNKGQAAGCTVRVREPVDKGYAALARGHQRGLQALAGMIATGLRAVAKGHAVMCRHSAG